MCGWVHFLVFFFKRSIQKLGIKKLNSLLDVGAEIKPSSSHSVTIGGIRVWTGNKWYSYAHPYGQELPECHPSIKTMIRFNEAVDKEIFK